LIVVSDTSPVLSLARIGRLELLQLLYQQVLIPSAVHDELQAAIKQAPALRELVAVPWLVVARPTDQRRVEQLCGVLDVGEAESIVLPSSGTPISS
jgi:predicted nucleic acid-binding protein